jgi:hypothetical protein
MSAKVAGKCAYTGGCAWENGRVISGPASALTDPALDHTQSKEHVIGMNIVAPTLARVTPRLGDVGASRRGPLSAETRAKIAEAIRKSWLERPRMSAEQRLLRLITEHDGHWLWTGNVNNAGYATLRFQESNHYAHRLAYETFVGPIPTGLQIDHLCRTPLCINPAHLEPVTQRENIRRGNAPSTLAARTGVCQRGHEFTPENTYVRKDSKRVMCRACQRLRRSKSWDGKR